MGILQPYSTTLAGADRDGGLRRLVNDALQETIGICVPVYIYVCVTACVCRLVATRKESRSIPVHSSSILDDDYDRETLGTEQTLEICRRGPGGEQCGNQENQGVRINWQ